MGENIQAIETIYDGYRFRSRLEARWAVFFNAIGLEYKYEFEGFKGFDNVCYLPDFWFPKQNIYAEVKGTDESLRRDGDRIGKCIDYNYTPISNGLIILGEIPNPFTFKWGNIPMFDFLYCDSGVRMEHATFKFKVFETPKGIVRIDSTIITGNENILNYIFSYERASGLEYSIPTECSTKPDWTYDSLYGKTEEYFSELKNAYAKARQARFEHGETPEVVNW